VLIINQKAIWSEVSNRLTSLGSGLLILEIDHMRAILRMKHNACVLQTLLEKLLDQRLCHPRIHVFFISQENSSRIQMTKTKSPPSFKILLLRIGKIFTGQRLGLRPLIQVWETS